MKKPTERAAFIGYLMGCCLYIAVCVVTGAPEWPAAAIGGTCLGVGIGWGLLLGRRR
jgi:hypothetical protein